MKPAAAHLAALRRVRDAARARNPDPRRVRHVVLLYAVTRLGERACLSAWQAVRVRSDADSARISAVDAAYEVVMRLTGAKEADDSRPVASALVLRREPTKDGLVDVMDCGHVLPLRAVMSTNETIGARRCWKCLAGLPHDRPGIARAPKGAFDAVRWKWWWAARLAGTGIPPVK